MAQRIVVPIRFFSNSFAMPLKHPKNIWIHAVSVGEVLAIEGIVKQLKVQHPDKKIILSTVTRTGQNLAIEKFGSLAKIIYAPFDFSWVVKKYVALIKPVLYVAAETEIWPHLYHTLKHHQVPIIQINGRISDKSFKGYMKIKFLIHKTLACVSCFCMQSPLDAKRIKQLGALDHRVKILGNLKFDNLEGPEVVRRDMYGYVKEDIILMAGSTHPGEENIMLNIYAQLVPHYTNLKLILAPRHIERSAEVVKLIQEKNMTYERISKKVFEDRPDVLLVDTIGQLKALYSLADIVFVGKTLVGVGGQNILEPASFAKPIIVGPHMQNFKDIMTLFQKDDAIMVAHNDNELCTHVKQLIEDKTLAQNMGQRAKHIIENNRGANDKTLEIIASYIKV